MKKCIAVFVATNLLGQVKVTDESYEVFINPTEVESCHENTDSFGTHYWTVVLKSKRKYHTEQNMNEFFKE